MSVGFALESKQQKRRGCHVQFQSDVKRITRALKPPTGGKLIKEQNNVSWTETHICLGH